MIPYDIHIAYVQVEDGKYRPVVILFEEESAVAVYKITSQYEGKNDAIRSYYLAITDWQEAGLAKPSYIDMVKVYKVPLASLRRTPIGTLSARDREVLITAINS